MEKAAYIKVDGVLCLVDEEEIEFETITYLRDKFIEWVEEQGLEFGGTFGGYDKNEKVISDF
jgi:hypothetical protein